MGAISAVLTVWDCWNSVVIQRMGMAWDTGPPIWPYQTPDILLHLLNLPALLLTFGLVSPKQHLAWYPMTILMWWGIGTLLDWKKKTHLKHRSYGLVAVLLLFSACFVWFGTAMAVDACRWWHDIGEPASRNTALILLRLGAAPAWCFGIAVFLVVRAIRVVQMRAHEQKCETRTN
jgi:hypothetical protein